jgi:hypothetical protein
LWEKTGIDEEVKRKKKARGRRSSLSEEIALTPNQRLINI